MKTLQQTEKQCTTQNCFAKEKTTTIIRNERVGKRARQGEQVERKRKKEKINCIRKYTANKQQHINSNRQYVSALQYKLIK